MVGSLASLQEVELGSGNGHAHSRHAVSLTLCGSKQDGDQAEQVLYWERTAFAELAKKNRDDIIREENWMGARLYQPVGSTERCCC